MRREFLKAGMLGLWLLLPSLAVLLTDHLTSVSDAVGLLVFALFVLAAPLVLLPRVRTYFLLWTPLSALAVLYCYLTLTFRSVPGDALVQSALNTGLGMSWQVVSAFGWRVWLLPASLVAYAALACSIDPAWRLSASARKGLLALLLVPAMLLLVARQALPQHFQLPPVFEHGTANLAFPSGLAMSLARQAHLRNKTYASVRGRATNPATPLLVVLVVGESLRADHLPWNGYTRNTMPLLQAMGPDIINFGDVASTANWTFAAFPAIVMRERGEVEFNLAQTFREAGFRNAWISNQEPVPYSLGSHVMEHATGTQDYHFRTDANLLPMFTSFVRQAGPRQFVLLHMNGSHFPYEERYGIESKVYAPTLADLGGKMPALQDKAAAINSYDNTIVESDRFLARVIEVLKKEGRPAVLLFTSDHGENLFDDERQLILHSRSGATRYDAHVPMLAWMNESYRAAFPTQAAALRANQARKISHVNVFPTVLELAGVEWDGRDSSESFASPTFREHRRRVRIDLTRWEDYDGLQ
ncbi:Phosphoethanolamine transferase for glucans (OPG), alkaline phosphatase superfamily [Duganella sp. CF458]|uniref:phosphoethanolamine transferase n=1 Tax=Duganella sp. CF458 TaxID=1884368 RepID=UPI0008E69A6D|nr:phosphoethanolamine transferase [Duganella sp. CF458]SFG34217.1 Phosphoethanolamine transferase for glucans (OPG), alkaline phosphatase superfamily [Duganella sp. CF458]